MSEPFLIWMGWAMWDIPAALLPSFGPLFQRIRQGYLPHAWELRDRE